MTQLGIHIHVLTYLTTYTFINTGGVNNLVISGNLISKNLILKLLLFLLKRFIQLILLIINTQMLENLTTGLEPNCQSTNHSATIICSNFDDFLDTSGEFFDKKKYFEHQKYLKILS